MGEKHYNWMHDLMPVRETRQATNKILEMIDECLLDPKDVATWCLKWMSEEQVKDMARVYELFEEEEEDDAD